MQVHWINPLRHDSPERKNNRSHWVILGIGILTALLLAQTACTPPPPSSPTTADSVPKKGPLTDGKFRVGFISTQTPTTIDVWNDQGNQALALMEKEFGAIIIKRDAVLTPKERERAFTALAEEGCNVVIGHGREFMPEALLIAGSYPNTLFVVTNGDQESSNVASLVFELGQASYLAGAIAAKVSKTGHVGAIGRKGDPDSRKILGAFRNGALKANPDIHFSLAYLDDPTDVAKAREATIALIDRGSDLVAHDCGAAAAGVFEAAKERNVLVFGAWVDQIKSAPDQVLMSCVANVPAALADLVWQMKEGKKKGGIVRLGIKENVVGFVVNEKLKSGRINPEIEGELNFLMREIMTAEINVYQSESDSTEPKIEFFDGDGPMTGPPTSAKPKK